MTAMTISDTERREVARRLRSVGLDDIRYSDAICEVMMCAGLTCVGDEDCHGSDERPECVVRVFARLADLIEPAPKRSEATPKCDREALLALADAMDGHADEMHDGCNFASSGDMRDYARRIREACGEAAR